MHNVRRFPMLFLKLLAFSLAASLSLPASAQFSDSYNFLKAVRERDGDKATEIISKPGSGQVMINTRDSSTGQTGLHIVIEEKDGRWTGFLLQKGANPDVADKQGVTPLMLAVQINFVEGMDWLIRYKANVNARNRSGETALIRAVQLRNLQAVKSLMKAGADPNITDNLAGMSALDYARRDNRSSAITDVLEGKQAEEEKAEGAQGELDFSGIGGETF